MEQRAKATIPCEQKFLSCMAFSIFINEVVRMASLSRGYFVYAPGETKITTLATDKSRERLRIKTLKAMQERR